MSDKEQELQEKILQLEEKNRDLVDRVRQLSLESRDQYQLIQLVLEFAPVGMLLFDSSRDLVQINRAAEQMLGINRVSTIGKSCENIFHCYQAKGTCPVLGEGKTLDRVETVCVTQENNQTLLRSAVKSRMGDEPLVMEVVIDISDIKEAQRAMVTANRTKDEFLAKMSHELRTPLNAILGFGELICEEVDEIKSDDLLHYMKSITTSGKNMLNIVDELLELTAIEADSLKPETLNLDLQAFTKEMESVFDALPDSESNRFTVILDDDLDSIVVDYQMLRKIIVNLLKNANKFTHEGLVQLKIYPVEVAGKAKVHFEVEDTGVGISADKIESIFEPFEQVDNSSTRRYGGVGMGLAIARQLAKLIDGSISVKSELGKGSVFTLSLPLYKGL